MVGILDFKTFLENTQDYRRDLRRAEYGDERDPEIAGFFHEISPLRNARAITEAEQIAEAVREKGGAAWYLKAMDEGHGFRKKSNRDFLRAAETLFLQDVFAGGVQ